jgi:hypothetical protein
VETLANLEARAAVQSWDRGEGDEAIRQIDVAIGRLESLVRTTSPDPLADGAALWERAAATDERLALLAGARKRKAVMTTGRARIALLEQALAGYRKARSRETDEYPLVNALMLQLALGWQRGGLSPAARRELLGEAQRLEAELEVASATRRDFWTAAMLGDVALIAALCSPGGGAPALDVAGERYRAASRRGSPRQLASAIEQLEFLVRMADGQPALVRSLTALRGEILPREAEPAAPDSAPSAARRRGARRR